MSDLQIEKSISSSEQIDVMLTKSINEFDMPNETLKDMSISEQSKPEDIDEDLEDGEIDDDDDADGGNDQENNEEDKSKDVTATVILPVTTLDQTNLKTLAQQKTNTQVVIDLLDERTVTPPPIIAIAKSKKAQPLEDDHASSIEFALANALKKRGIDPPMPKIVSSPPDATDLQVQSRSSRRRKRKKQRENKEQEKERKEKKKRYDSSEAISGGDDEDMDEYEMLNVRGGSPPPTTITTQFSNYKDNYESAEDSDSSYDSYDSADGTTAAGVNIERRRRQATQRREPRKRRERNQNQNQREKRSRRDSIDEKHQRPQEPRKLELCKFYLMECCAKKEKCSYMHSDFPCKFYYLGMDCTLGKECKFGHGEPLNEQLRNILLKHLETAPKEILGNFKRISREQALAQLNKRHEELCNKFNVENTWTTSLLNVPAAGTNNNSLLLGHRRNAMNVQNVVDSLHQQTSLANANISTPNKIPSLLDMVINPPHDVSGHNNTTSIIQNNNKMNDNNNKQQQRKSRWAGETTEEINANNANKDEDNKNSPPSYLDLCNLTGILSMEHIEKLTQMGISNLEQVNQLTFGQLNQIGLTITEISDIQAKLQGNNHQHKNSHNSTNIDASNDKNTDNKNDVTITTTTTMNTPENSNKNKEEKGKEITTTTTTATIMPSSINSSNSKFNNNSSTGTTDSFDYTQYLRDSNITFDRLESYDDEKDDEKLIIDDGNMETDEGGNTPVASSGDEVKVDLDVATHSITSSSNSSTNRQKSTTGFYNAIQRNNPFRSFDAETQNRERSQTPTRSQSSTPEATESPDPDDMSQGNYERATIYDYNPLIAAQEEDEEKADRAAALADTENRLQADGLQLPFTPVTNFTPATEIDGSITSYLPMPYKVYELDLDRPSYIELRKQSKPSDLISDPRLRRILGLPELRPDTPVEASSLKTGQRGLRKLSNNIASPDSEGASPKYYIPPSSNQYTESKLSKTLTSIGSSYSSSSCTITTATASTTTISKSIKNSGTTAPSDPRARQMDPRRAAAAASSKATSVIDAKDVATAGISLALKQNIEIRNLLQQSEWYKNLNSKFKIMVNQQLALVSTELKKFHQNSSTQKIFDISFILNNSTLQQILTQLGIYIDDNGEVAHIDGDNEEQQHQQLQQQIKQQHQQNGNGRQIHLPNLSQPPPDFLRGPPPNLTAPPPNLSSSLQNMPSTTQIFRPALNITPFGVMPPNARPSLLGLPPTVGNVSGNAFNPFSADLPSAAFAAGLLGPGHVPFANFSGGPPNQNAGIMLPGNMRNFGNNNNSNAQRNGNRNNRRNKI